MQLLVVEDEVRLANALAEIFESKKYHVDVVHDGEDGYQYGKTGLYDCIVLDVMLPIMDGFKVLKKLREEHIETPIIMLTAKDSIADKVNGLNFGADDYMTKPFSADELVARINALTRRKGEVIIDSVTFGDLKLVLSTNDLININNEKSVRLNYKEAEIIAKFLKNPSLVISKEDLIVSVWGYDSNASDNNVEAYISFIRRKLHFLESKCEISAIKKVGYVLKEN